MGLFGVGGQGTDLDTNCDGLSASSCDTRQPIGGGAFGYVGWSFDPVGFELMLAGLGRHADGEGEFHERRCRRARRRSRSRRARRSSSRRASAGSWRCACARRRSGASCAGTVAGGVGLSYKQLFMERTTNDHGRHQPLGRLQPDAEQQRGVRLAGDHRRGGAFSFASRRRSPCRLGMVMWADNASIAGTNSTPAQDPRVRGRERSASRADPDPRIPPGHGAAGVSRSVPRHAVRAVSRRVRRGRVGGRRSEPRGTARYTLGGRARAARRRSLLAPPAPPGRRSGARGRCASRARSSCARSTRPSAKSTAGASLSVRRVGKRIVFDFDGDLHLVLHLMIAGRLRWRPRRAAKVAGEGGPRRLRLPGGNAPPDRGLDQEARVALPRPRRGGAARARPGRHRAARRRCRVPSPRRCGARTTPSSAR